ncbi:MAG: NADH-quinone oxidoreductase subunit N, partial [Campylobacteraceae bacterium]|nr:NADH-quinone oxidoreductase subunit N [Campylobacteraceae bacterium]
LALIMALNSAIAVYYYVKPVVFMFFKEGVEVRNTAILTNSTTILKTLIGVFALLSIGSIFLVEPLIEFISYYVQISGY